MELQQHQSLTQRQEQVQTLSHAQLQSLQVLMATTQELNQQLTDILQNNPVLEIAPPAQEVLVGDLMRPTENEEEREDFAAHVAEYDENLGEAASIDATGDDIPDYGILPERDRDSEERQQYFFDSLSTGPTMLDRLLEQLRDETGSNQALYAAGQTVLGNLDDNG